jgi:hypothetical protein
MKRQLRVSNYKDYVAVDMVDESKPEKPIIATPLYLERGKPVQVFWKDEEENKWFKAELLFDGDSITATDIDNCSGFAGILQMKINFQDLLDEKQFRFYGVITC